MGVVIGFALLDGAEMATTSSSTAVTSHVTHVSVSRSSGSEQATESNDLSSTTSSSLPSADHWSTVCVHRNNTLAQCEPVQYCFQQQKFYWYTLSLGTVKHIFEHIWQFHEHKWRISWAVQHSLIIKNLSTIGSPLLARTLLTKYESNLRTEYKWMHEFTQQ